jgi:serine/threonine protein kinase
MEVYILRRLSHNNIARLLDYFEDAQFFYIVTEFHGCSPVHSKVSTEKDRKPSKESRTSSDSFLSTDLFEYVESRGCLDETTSKYIFPQLTLLSKSVSEQARFSRCFIQAILCRLKAIKFFSNLVCFF